jgi:TolB protein
MCGAGRRAVLAAATLMAAACSGGEPAEKAPVDTDTVAPPPADAVEGASWSRDGRRLAVTWLRGKRSRVYGLFGPVKDTILPAPSRGLPITARQGSDATWSADGFWVAFATTRTGNSEIYRVRPDGTGPENLTRNPSQDVEPAYSPDGAHIAFASDRDGGAFRIYVMRADGSDPRAVAADVPGRGQRRPAWSPDGRVLAFAVQGVGVVIWVDTLSTGRVGKLGPGDQPAWSSDGRSVFFVAGDSIMERRADGGPPHLVVAGGWAPAPSPGARWLAFVRGTDKASALYLLDLRTKTEVRITSSPGAR